MSVGPAHVAQHGLPEDEVEPSGVDASGVLASGTAASGTLASGLPPSGIVVLPPEPPLPVVLHSRWQSEPKNEHPAEPHALHSS